MAVKSIFVLCVIAVLTRCITTCPCDIRNLANPVLVAAPSGCGRAVSLAAPVLNTSGGVLAVTSSSPLAPHGITVASENVIEGIVNVVGALPYVSAVAFEGQLPSAGSAGVSYGCGDNVAITSTNAAPATSSYTNLGASAVGPSNLGLTNVGLSNLGLTNVGLSNLGLTNLNVGSPCGCGIRL